MGRIYLELKNGNWERVAKSDFWLDEALLNMLDQLKMIQSKNWDGVIIIDGPERAGKSVLGMAIGHYMSNGKMTENNFATGLSDCAVKISELPDGSVIQVDEGSLMFSGKDSLNKDQKFLMKLLDVVGQKNLIFIICLPCFFDLNKTIAVRRSKFLLHVYPDEHYNRGSYAFWGEKSKPKLYRIGKKNFDSYDYPPAKFIGKYPEFHPIWYDKYIKKIKKKSLDEALGLAKNGHQLSSADVKKVIKEYTIKLINNYEGISKTKLAKAMNMDRGTIYTWMKELAEKKDSIGVTVVENEVVRGSLIKPLMEK